MNHFAELEDGAEAFWREAQIDRDDLYAGLVKYLGELGVQVRIVRTAEMQGAVRRYDEEAKVLNLSEVLRRGSRNFQLAYQIGLLTMAGALDRIAVDPHLTSASSRALARVALANYFAAAVLMPYGPFLEAARSERYDIDLLGHRFRTSFEQTAHRLTTLRRPGAEGVPLHMVRVDIAGNISKRFSASGLRFARFSGACPRWNVFEAFTTPGLFRTQLSQMPDGATYFWVARTVNREGGGYHAPALGARRRARLRGVAREGARLRRRRRPRESQGGGAGRAHLSPLRADGLRAAGLPAASASTQSERERPRGFVLRAGREEVEERDERRRVLVQVDPVGPGWDRLGDGFSVEALIAVAAR